MKGEQKRKGLLLLLMVRSVLPVCHLYCRYATVAIIALARIPDYKLSFCFETGRQSQAKTMFRGTNSDSNTLPSPSQALQRIVQKHGGSLDRASKSSALAKVEWCSGVESVVRALEPFHCRPLAGQHNMQPISNWTCCYKNPGGDKVVYVRIPSGVLSEGSGSGVVATLSALLGKTGKTSLPSGKMALPIEGLGSLYHELPAFELLQQWSFLSRYTGPLREWVALAFESGLGCRHLYRFLETQGPSQVDISKLVTFFHHGYRLLAKLERKAKGKLAPIPQVRCGFFPRFQDSLRRAANKLPCFSPFFS